MIENLFSGFFFLRLVIAVLATYSLSHAAALETGPFALFDRLRDWAARKYGYEHWINQFFNCPLCMAQWISIPVFLMAFSSVWWLFAICAWLSIRGFVVLLHGILYN